MYFTCHIFQNMYFNVVLKQKNLLFLTASDTKKSMFYPTLPRHPIQQLGIIQLFQPLYHFQWGVKDMYEFSTHSFSILLQFGGSHVPEKKEEDCWSLHMTLPEQLCQGFPRLSPDLVTCWKTQVSEVIGLIIMVYYSKWIKSKIIKGKIAHGAKSGGN